MESTLQRMTEALQIRGYSPDTVTAYFAHARGFLKHTQKDPSAVHFEDVWRYLVHLKNERMLAGSTINQALFGIRFLYLEVLDKSWDKKLRCHKHRRKLPVVLTREEVRSLFEATDDFKNRAVLMTMYSAGLRVREATNLHCRDIESPKMRIHIRNGKGQKERYTMLSKKLLDSLRQYWKVYRPREVLFFGIDRDRSIHVRTIQRAFNKSRDRAGIRKPASCHSLRHSFATHLLENGTNIRYIQELLGHKSIQSTLVYLKVTPQSVSSVQSPLDQLTLR